MLRTLAALVILTASTRSLLPDVSNYCSIMGIQVGGYYCASCLQPVYCDVTVTPPTVKLAECASGEVCVVGATDCVSPTPATQCYCTSNLCDPFNWAYSVVCGTAGISDIEDCVSLSQQCEVGSCVSCASFGEGWRPITPACTAGYRCDAFNAVDDRFQCSDGQYLNEDGNCVTSPPTPCADLCAGYCPDLTDCTRYYVCDGFGGMIGVVNTCPSGQYFNPDAAPPACQSNSALCSLWTECEFDSSTVTDVITTTPNSATTLPPCTADTVGNYPFASCNSSYWSCRDLGGGDYQYVQLDCPGELVFNLDPYYPFCDYRTNVTECA